MGAFHDLFQPQRETNLNVRLEEYLRFGLEAGSFMRRKTNLTTECGDHEETRLKKSSSSASAVKF
jgi:hypothetical protein